MKLLVSNLILKIGYTLPGSSTGVNQTCNGGLLIYIMKLLVSNLILKIGYTLPGSSTVVNQTCNGGLLI